MCGWLFAYDMLMIDDADDSIILVFTCVTFIDDFVISFPVLHCIGSFLYSFLYSSFPCLQMFCLSPVTFALMSSSLEALLLVVSPWVVCRGRLIFGSPLGPVRWYLIGFVLESLSDGKITLWNTG